MTNLTAITPIWSEWQMALGAIKSYYSIVNEILLPVDVDRISWAGKKFDFDLAAFADAVRAIDPEHKCVIVQGDFHGSGPLENHNHERKLVGSLARQGNWLLAIDGDERLLEAEKFKDWLDNSDTMARVHAALPNPWTHNLPVVGIMSRMEIVYKIIGDVALLAVASDGAPAEMQPMCSWRRTLRCPEDFGEHVICVMSPSTVVHFAYGGRTAEQIRQKLSNQSHACPFDAEAFMRTWEGVTLENYQELRNFHPIDPGCWASLRAVTGVASLSP